MDTIRILGIPGSLRAASTNRALLRAAGELLPPGASLEVAEIGDFPLYNGDLVIDGVLPDGPDRVKAQVVAADALLIATPEYNYGIPGPLKNALDWISRPAFRSCVAGKKVALLGTAPGIVGTSRAQGHLRQVLFGMAAEVFPHPEVLVGRSGDRFTDGALTDEETRDFLETMLTKFVAWARP